MLIYKISHTESGEQYSTVAEQDIAGLINHIDNIAAYLCAGDKVTVEVVGMADEEYASLPEFQGY